MGTSNVERIFRFAKNRIGKYPFNTIIISKKNQSRRPIYGINSLPQIISPFDQSFLFEYNFLKEFLHTYLEESINYNKRKRYWETDGGVIYLMMDYVEKYYPNLSNTETEELRINLAASKLSDMEFFNAMVKPMRENFLELITL